MPAYWIQLVSTWSAVALVLGEIFILRPYILRIQRDESARWFKVRVDGMEATLREGREALEKEAIRRQAAFDDQLGKAQVELDKARESLEAEHDKVHPPPPSIGEMLSDISNLKATMQVINLPSGGPMEPPGMFASDDVTDATREWLMKGSPEAFVKLRMAVELNQAMDFASEFKENMGGVEDEDH